MERRERDCPLFYTQIAHAPVHTIMGRDSVESRRQRDCLRDGEAVFVSQRA